MGNSIVVSDPSVGARHSLVESASLCFGRHYGPVKDLGRVTKRLGGGWGVGFVTRPRSSTGPIWRPKHKQLI